MVTRSKLSKKLAINLDLDWKTKTLFDAGVVGEQIHLTGYSCSLSEKIYREDQ